MLFDEEKQKSRGLDDSTFDIVRVQEFHNVRFGTIMSYLWVWILFFAKLIMLASDTYTCVNLLVYKRWGTDGVDVYEYKIAKWIFTGCIGFRFLLLSWQIGWAIHTYRTGNIALAFLNNYARLMYAISSYDYHCLFHDIELKTSLPWASFLVYYELDNALEMLVADAPRQVVNIMTLKKYATGDDMNSNVLKNIEFIATTNTKLSVILSLILCSVVIFLFFFFKFCFAIVFCFIPVKVKVSRKGYKSIKAFCYAEINDRVRLLVLRHHKPKQELLLEGILDLQQINANPLLNSSTTLNLGDGDGFTHPAFRKMSAMDKPSVNVTESVDTASEYSRPPRAYTRMDSMNSTSDMEKRAFRTYTSETIMTESSTSSRGYERPLPPLVNRASYVTHQTVEEETESYDDHSQRSDDELVSHQDTDQFVDNELVSDHGRDQFVDPDSPLLDNRSEYEGLFDDGSGAPYPVRGVSKYFHRD